mmetsp:Transcript_22351/g.29239  ORF Transcript_22351/g.29239 Transcript_22351/m.29239 type:complete len:254 (+) Transcript_22351:103-864(+)
MMSIFINTFLVLAILFALHSGAWSFKASYPSTPRTYGIFKVGRRCTQLNMLFDTKEKAAILKQMEDKMADLEKKIYESDVASKYSDAKLDQLKTELKTVGKEKDSAIKQSQDLVAKVNQLTQELENERTRLQSTKQALGAVQAYEEKIAQLETEVEVKTAPAKASPAKKAAPAKAAAKPEKAPTAAPAPASAVTPSEDEEWKALSVAQLKKKKVADLQEFLSKRNIEAVDSTGKPLKKALLLSKTAHYLGKEI